MSHPFDFRGAGFFFDDVCWGRFSRPLLFIISLPLDGGT
jgi:hypothetical protein